MEFRFRLTRRRLALVAAMVAVAATGSIGWAAIGDDGTIQGCVTAAGTIDAIDPLTQACKERQSPVEWYTKAGADASFLAIGGKAADADKLDGRDSSAFGRRTIAGFIGLGGDVLGGSGGFTVITGPGVGEYRVLFPAGTWSPPAVGSIPFAVIVQSFAGGRVAVDAVFESGFHLRTFNDDGSPAARLFQFIAVQL